MMKVNIAIIEDEKPFVDHLYSLLEQWAAEKKHMLNVQVFRSGNTFLMNWENKNNFDVIFIDVMLPDGLDGIHISKLIRMMDKKVEIIFVTNVTSEIGEGYRVSAMQYLIKPAVYSDIKFCMDKIAEMLLNQNEDNYCFYKNKDSISRIPYRQILYFSSALQYTEIHTTQTVERQLERLKNIEGVLPDMFVRCHRSIIVNIEAVYSITPSLITLINQTNIPISKTYFKNVKQKFLDYFKQGNL